MAQTKDEKKRIGIRDAVISDVVEYGLGNAPISRIAKRAGVSAGTIYIYYPNKDEMLQSIFMEIKSTIHEVMMDAHQSERSSGQGIRAMWFAMYEFILEHPDMFAFHEAVSSEKLLKAEQRVNANLMAKDIHDILVTAINDGTLKAMPIDSLVSLLIAPAVSLARRQLKAEHLNKDDAKQLFDAIWLGIADQSD